ncbi:MAG: sulfite exporter TauE/SafE family protein [Candidatus Omnitrophota bacterium]|nr:MAG: sulfite exporter TauE/SafE family protein [Candidatus Omnitrophota bacterium]
MDWIINFLISLQEFIAGYSLLGIPASFLGGIFVALTPCILPLLPVTFSIIGEAALASGRRSFLLSIIFVLGITVNYVTLGVIAAVFGVLMSRLISSFLLYLILGVVFIFLGLSFFDLFHFSVFSVNYKSRSNLISIFILGVICGLYMIPCALPVLGAILSLISLKKNIVYGIFCLFSFSLGYGLIFVLVGSSASLVKKLADKKHWVVRIKRVLGVVMILGGIYFFLNLMRVI